MFTSGNRQNRVAQPPRRAHIPRMSEPIGLTIFETAIGPCGLAWSADGIVGAQLPEPNRAAAYDRLKRRFPDAQDIDPPAYVAEARDRIVRLLDGEAVDLSDLPLDLSEISELHQRVYAVARSIQPGSTLTYGEIAQRLGDKALAREVGQAMGKNRFPIIVPCHRVLAASGKTGGFSAPGGVDTKMRLLTIEKARTTDAPMLFDDLPLARK